MVFPFLWQILMSLSSTAEVTSVPPTLWPSELRFDNYLEVFRQVPFLDQFWVSVQVAVATVIGQIVLCSMAGYAFARMRFAASAIIFAVMLSILIEIPNQAYVVPQYQIVQSLGWLDTMQGIVIPTVFSAFGTFLMRQFFVNLPKELEEAARLDGANSFQIFWKVMLPLARPSIGALAIITILAAWNNLLWPLVVTGVRRTGLSVGIASLNGQYVIDYPVMMAASLMAMAPILILFIVMQRRVIEGLARIRGSRAERIRLQPRRRATAHALRELVAGFKAPPEWEIVDVLPTSSTARRSSAPCVCCAALAGSSEGADPRPGVDHSSCLEGLLME